MHLEESLRRKSKAARRWMNRLALMLIDLLFLLALIPGWLCRVIKKRL